MGSSHPEIHNRTNKRNILSLLVKQSETVPEHVELHNLTSALKNLAIHSNLESKCLGMWLPGFLFQLILHSLSQLIKKHDWVL